MRKRTKPISEKSKKVTAREAGLGHAPVRAPAPMPRPMPLSQPPRIPIRWASAIALGLAALAWFAFAPVLENGFVDLDDYANIRDDHEFRGLGWKQVAAAFTKPRLANWQPLASLLWSAQSVACGVDPAGYHATSLAVHALNAVVLFALALTVLRRWNPALLREHPRTFTIATGLAVAWYAVHPARTEPVAWVTGQPYLPCALFEMLALLAYLRAHPAGGGSPGVSWLAGAYALAFAAMLFLPGAVCLPFLFLILDAALLGRLDLRAGAAGLMRRAGGLVVEKLPLLVPALALMPVAYWAKRSSQVVKQLEYDSPWARLAQAGYGVWLYLEKMVAPFGLSAFYPRPEGGDFRSPVYAAAVIGVVVVSVAVVALWKRVRWLPLVWAAYLLVLAPHLGLIRVGHTIAADRYCYVASIFWVIPLAGGLTLLGRLPGLVHVRLATLATGLALVVGIACLARTQARTWHDSESLWHHALVCAPGSSQTHANYATALSERGEYAAAVAEFDRALAIWPRDPETLVKRGTALAGQKDYDEAIRSYRAALALRPDDAMAFLNLGAALAVRGQYDDAIAMYRKALAIKPGHAQASINLGTVLIQQRKLVQAEMAFQEALEAEPWNVEAHTSLGVARAMQGNLDGAIAAYQEALHENPDHVSALLNLGIAQAQSGHPGEALPLLLSATRLEPGNADAHHALGATLASLGRVDEAVAEFTEALRINPGHAQAARLLAMARGQRGRELPGTRYR